MTRATLGETFVDPTFYDFFYKIKYNGIRRGPYHFLTPGDIGNQAQFFLDVITHAQFQRDDILCMDWEDIRNTPSEALQWLQHVERETGIRPIIYSSRVIIQAVLNGMLAPSWFADYFWWCAGYPPDPDQFLSIPAWYIPPGVPQHKVAGWQYAENCIYPGVPGETDVNWTATLWAQSIHLHPPTEGNNPMFKNDLTPRYTDGCKIRLEPSTSSSQVASLPYGKHAYGNGEPTTRTGEVWYPVVEANGVAVIGYIAAVYNNDTKATVTVNDTTPPVDPNQPLNISVTVAPDGYEPVTVKVVSNPKP